MEFKELVNQRYATKKFDGSTVDDEKIAYIKEMMQFAPSTINLQPWHIIVITDKELREKLQPHSFNQPQITTCSHLFVICARTDLTERLAQVKQSMLDQGTPEEKAEGFANMAGGWIQNMPQEVHLPWMQRQVFLALAHGMLAAKEQGLDSCPMEGFDPAKYAEILALPENVVPTVLMPVGVAADTPHPKNRLDQSITFEER